MSPEAERPAGQGTRQAGEPATGGGSAGGSGDAGGAAAGSRTSKPARKSGETVPNMLPGRSRRRLGAERALTRLIATAGIVAIGVAIAAIMVSSNSDGWLVGLVVSVVSVVLSAILWSSRQL